MLVSIMPNTEQKENKTEPKENKQEVEYFCWNEYCGYRWKDIVRKGPYLCPKCKSHKITHRVP